MIIDLPNTSTSQVAKALVEVREEGGAVALGRVLTLVIITRRGAEEHVIDAANAASREHPMRVIVLMISDPDGPAKMDAQIRVGGDAGASEVVALEVHGKPGQRNLESLITGILLPDAPVVVWWPDETPDVPSKTSIGRIAKRRISDSDTKDDPARWMDGLGRRYAPGDTDMAWTRLTPWREQLAAVLDQPPYEPVLSAEVIGAEGSPATALMAAWLRLTLDCPVEYEYLPRAEFKKGIKSVTLRRASGDIVLERINPETAILSQPCQPTHEIAFARKTLRECLAEELRRIDGDPFYGRVVREGWPLLDPPRKPRT